ncbi:hypothetical protein HDV02_001155 [Globomyces sp. JEL0801]|nr:hypothetical protein HDV02_001155 [Globomyces sp. JEL0801]
MKLQILSLATLAFGELSVREAKCDMKAYTEGIIAGKPAQTLTDLIAGCQKLGNAQRLTAAENEFIAAQAAGEPYRLKAAKSELAAAQTISNQSEDTNPRLLAAQGEYAAAKVAGDAGRLSAAEQQLYAAQTAIGMAQNTNFAGLSDGSSVASKKTESTPSPSPTNKNSAACSYTLAHTIFVGAVLILL